MRALRFELRSPVWETGSLTTGQSTRVSYQWQQKCSQEASLAMHTRRNAKQQLPACPQAIGCSWQFRTRQYSSSCLKHTVFGNDFKSDFVTFCHFFGISCPCDFVVMIFGLEKGDLGRLRVAEHESVNILTPFLILFWIFFGKPWLTCSLKNYWKNTFW